jgi:hypothetical protein
VDAVLILVRYRVAASINRFLWRVIWPLQLVVYILLLYFATSIEVIQVGLEIDVQHPVAQRNSAAAAADSLVGYVAFLPRRRHGPNTMTGWCVFLMAKVMALY